jgi:hypothetical protein
MKTKTLATAVALLVGMTTAWVARAFDIVGTLGDNENAVDVFTITCQAGTNRAVAYVWDLVDPAPVNNTARMRVFLIEAPNAPSLHREDIAPNVPPGIGEGGGASTPASLGTGAGTYQAHIYKTFAGPESYQLRIQCLNPGGGNVAGAAPQQQGADQ